MNAPLENETAANTKPPQPKSLRRGLAWLALSWEMIWPAIWPTIAVAGLFVVLALLDALPQLPALLHALILVGFAIVLLTQLWRAGGQIRFPSAAEATRKIEKDSGLEHRPLATIDDRPASNTVDPETDRIWKLHLARAAAAAKNTRLRWPNPNLAGRDPYALRAALVLALAVGLIVAGQDGTTRLARAFTPDLSALSERETASLEIWVTPPEYTNLPPRLLASADPANLIELEAGARGAIPIPVGSVMLVQVNSGRGAPVLRIGETDSALDEISENAWRTQTSLDNEGSISVSVLQSREELGHWDIDVIPDTAPDIRFGESPDSNDSNALRLSYESQDDYGVIEVHAKISWPGNPTGTGIGALKLELPLPRPDPRDGTAASIHDLTAHPWAGLEVDVQITATDGGGQSSVTDRLPVILPERSFNHPVAREIIAQRRVLALAPESRRDVARSLHNIGQVPDRFDNDLTVFLALMTARSRLVHEPETTSVSSVLSLLWDTALRLEDGTLSLAQRDVAKLQERLREALENEATEEEIAAIMEELRAALDRYLEALAQNFSQALKGTDLSTLPESGADLDVLDREAIQDMLSQLEQRARLGDAEGVEEMLERMQQMLQALQNAPDMLQQQQQNASPSQEMLRELQELLRRQQGLHDDTFRREQRGEPLSPSDSETARNAQNEIRRQLGELMRRLDELSNQIPENLGNAEDAMGEAERALGDGDLPGALGAQARALEELQRGGQQLALQIRRQRGPGQGPGEGFMAQPGEEGFDPLGRPRDRDGTTDGFVPNGQQAVGDGDQAARALKIQSEIRARLRDQGRPEAEIEYLLRLLKRF